MPTKPEWRKKLRNERDALPQDQVDTDSESIRTRVFELPEIIAAHSVFIYAATGSEVQTYTLIEDLLSLRKVVALPRITDAIAGVMEAVEIHSLKELVPDRSNFNLLTPCGRHTLDQPADVILMPGLAFSPVTGARLGMGGGYYDRHLANDRKHLSFRIGLAFDRQLADGWPIEDHDAAVHALVTPRRVIRIAKTG